MSTSRIPALGLVLAGLIGHCGPAGAQEPLSAIDWLSQSVAVPAAQPGSAPFEPAITAGAAHEDIAVTVLDGPSPDATGLLAPQVTGLPQALWGLGRSLKRSWR